MVHKPIICAQCGEKIPFGEPYFKVGDNFLQLKYFETDELNRFCSQNCLCEYLSVIEIPNDGSPSMDELILGKNNRLTECNENILRVRVWLDELLYAKHYGNPSDIPMCEHESKNYWRWDVTIDIKAGQILKWPNGKTSELKWTSTETMALDYMGKHYAGVFGSFTEMCQLPPP